MSGAEPVGHVEAVRDGHIGRIVIRNAARRNALSSAMLREMAAAVAALEADDAVRVIVVEGEGDRAFCAGADLSRVSDEADRAWNHRAYDGGAEGPFYRLLHSPKPTVAFIRGACFGGGIVLASVCDMRIATADSVVSLPATRIGVGYSHFAMTRLVSLIGSGGATEMLYTARRYDAAEAHALRFVDRIVTEEEGQASLHAITEGAPLSVRAAKLSIAAASGSPAARPISEIKAAIAACSESADLREGQAAFRERRAPRFEGR